MTENNTVPKKLGSHYGKALSLLITVGIFALAIFFSPEIRDGALFGMRTAALSVIPAVLPFMVLGDFASRYVQKNGLLGEGALGALYALPRQSVGALISGLLCGLPTGARLAALEYECGRCKRDDATRLCAVINNPSAAFILGGVGAGIIGDKRLGVILLISVLLSSLLISRIFSGKGEKYQNTDNIVGQNFDFVTSVKDAAASCINIFAFMAVFGACVRVVEKAALPELLFAYFASLLEVGSACAYAASIIADIDFLMLTLGFALGFGGLCAHLQSAVFIKKAALDFPRYLLMKLTQGIICALLSLFLFKGWCIIF